MTDHVPAPPYYVGGWEESPLTEPDRQHLRTVIRQLWRGRLDKCELALEAHPAIEKMALSYADVDAGLSLDVYVIEDAFDYNIIANERLDGAGMVTLNDDPHLLRDLGECWHHLESDLLTVLDLPVATVDLPQYTIPPVGLQCTTAQTGSLVCFAALFFARPDGNGGDAHQQ